jgi:hypothetical protein
MTPDGEWFTVRTGEHEGEWHLTGWKLDAIQTEQTSPRNNGWLSFGNCPRCHAVVIADKENPYGDLTWAHERWHAQTDYPVPSDPSTEGATG